MVDSPKHKLRMMSINTEDDWPVETLEDETWFEDFSSTCAEQSNPVGRMKEDDKLVGDGQEHTVRMEDAGTMKDSGWGCYMVEKNEDTTTNIPLLVKDMSSKQVEDSKGMKGMEDIKEDDHLNMKEDDWEDEDPEDILWFTRKMKEVDARNIPDKEKGMTSSTNPALPGI